MSRSQSRRSSTIPLRAWISLGILVAIIYGCGTFIRIPDSSAPRADTAGDVATVQRIVDGDTIVVTIQGAQETVRYVGIDTPERGQPGYRAATEANRNLVGGRTVTLQRDRTDRDAFGRLLRYIFLEDGTLVNGRMIADGWAMPVEYRPDTSRAAEFIDYARQAATQQRGFWSGDSPYDGAMGYALTTRATDLRRGPSSDQPTTAAVPADLPITVFGRSPNSRWLQVRLPNRNGGWISVNSVNLNVPVSSLPLGELEDVPTAPAPTATTSPTATAPTGGIARCPGGCITQPAPTCAIKGNVNRDGERIYHLPTNTLYTRTTLNPDEGDRWFCTTQEAEEAGFRPALR